MPSSGRTFISADIYKKLLPEDGALIAKHVGETMIIHTLLYIWILLVY
jgi:hypothetical protein